MDMHIIAGDLNFSDGWKENTAIQNYNYLWKHGKRYFSAFSTPQEKESGFTMPKTKRFKEWRPDHVIHHTKDKKEEQKQDQIEIIGDFTVKPFEKEHFNDIYKDNQIRTPSDHFGLITKIYL